MPLICQPAYRETRVYESLRELRSSLIMNATMRFLKLPNDRTQERRSSLDASSVQANESEKS